MVFIVVQNLVGIFSVLGVVFYLRVGTHNVMARHRGNVTSSAKPEVHNVFQRRQRRTDLPLQATCKKFGEVRPCGQTVSQTDRQTDRHRPTHSSTSHPKVKKTYENLICKTRNPVVGQLDFAKIFSIRKLESPASLLNRGDDPRCCIAT